MENKELLNKIKVYRAMKNISQEELAVAIGVTRKTINTVETGKFIPSTVHSCAEDSTLFRGSGGRNFLC